MLAKELLASSGCREEREAVFFGDVTPGGEAPRGWAGDWTL